MLFSKEYVAYLGRQVTQRLIQTEMIETKEVNKVADKVTAAIVDELSVEDRINEEVRFILEQYSDEMRTMGASYQEAFKKIKNQLVQKYKAVL
jgi:hypothetical protein